MQRRKLRFKFSYNTLRLGLAPRLVWVQSWHPYPFMPTWLPSPSRKPWEVLGKSFIPFPNARSGGKRLKRRVCTFTESIFWVNCIFDSTAKMIASQGDPPPPGGRQPCRNHQNPLLDIVFGSRRWEPRPCPSHGLSRTKWPSLPTAPVWPSPCALGPSESACAHTTRWTTPGIGGNPVSGRRGETAVARPSPSCRGGRGSVNECGFARLESGD